jgi:hypothetical protein
MSEHLSAFGGKADMSHCVVPTFSDAIDPKETSRRRAVGWALSVGRRFAAGLRGLGSPRRNGRPSRHPR